MDISTGKLASIGPLPPGTPQLLDYVNGLINLMTIDELEKRTVIQFFHTTFPPITDQTDGDIIRRIWNFIDYTFDNMKVDIRTGEMESPAHTE
ncbi:hypothetical protein INT45_002180 [Circinella minor]|uniref:Uncharacterized protein n=1 Tax=Circinella minor TaxID=1195481 RepID=A0A8H7VEE9_9FUNG|nr:hypothetical protein INT45_002180 [Circinella minor]